MRALAARLDALVDRLPVSPRFARFCAVGASGTLVNLAVLGVLHALLPAGWAPWSHRLAMAGAIGVSILSNFLLHGAWTWRDRPRSPGAAAWLTRLARFYAVSLAAAAVQWGVAVLAYERGGLAAWAAPIGLYLAQASGIAAALGVNFAANHLWTFRRPGTAGRQGTGTPVP